jgi:hypothetical protein
MKIITGLNVNAEKRVPRQSIAGIMELSLFILPLIAKA